MTLSQRRLRPLLLAAVSVMALVAAAAPSAAQGKKASNDRTMDTTGDAIASDYGKSRAKTTRAETGKVETLKSALIEAYNTNPQILAARAQLRAVDENLALANSGWRPRVIVNGSASRTDDRSDGIRSDGWNANVTATQPLFQGGQVLAQRDVAKAQIRSARAQLANTESQILLAVVTAYMDVVRDSAVVDLSQNQVDVLARELQASQDRFDVGEITRTDVAQSQARLSGARTQLINAQAQLEASRAAFTRLLGHNPGRLEAAPSMPALPASIKAALDSALARNYALVAARENQLASEATIGVQFSQLLPRVNLQAEYSRGENSSNSILSQGRDTDQTTFGVSGSIPLYQGGGEYASIRQAKQTNSQNILLATQAQRIAIEDTTNAWEGLQASRSAIQSAQDQVNANEIAYEGVRQEADVGARTTLDVLNAEQELLNSRVTLITNQRNEYVAAYSLLSASGRLSAGDLGLPVDVYDPTIHADEVAGKLIGVGD